jgi:hypothetical protein
MRRISSKINFRTHNARRNDSEMGEPQMIRIIDTAHIRLLCRDHSNGNVVDDFKFKVITVY